MKNELKIGARLREERERLNLSQVAFAKFGDVTRNTQSLYEMDERTPDAAYLVAISLAGADVLYILLGDYAHNTAKTPRELALLENYNNSPVEVQRGVSKLLAETGKALERAGEINTVPPDESKDEDDPLILDLNDID